MSKQRVCGDCAKYLTYDCPRCEYKDRERNRAACLPTDSICKEFQKKKEEKKPKPINKDSNVKCEDLIFDQRGNAICIANLDFPTYCKLENCPRKIVK